MKGTKTNRCQILVLIVSLVIEMIDDTASIFDIKKSAQKRSHLYNLS